MDQFGCLGFLSKIPIAPLFDQSKALATGTGFYPRDVIAAAANGHMFFSQTGIKITTPTASVKRSTAQTVTVGVQTKLTPNTVEWDNNQFWDSVTNPRRLTCKASGLYLLLGELRYSAGTAGACQIAFIVNGATEIALDQLTLPASQITVLSLSRIWYFEEGDYVEIQGYYSAGTHTIKIDFFAIVGITPEAVF